MVTADIDVIETIKHKLNEHFVGKCVLWLCAQIAEPHFITLLTIWLIKNVARLVEPLLLAAGVYTLLAKGIPDWNQPWLYNLSLSVMIGAPDVIMPGGFLAVADQWKKSRVAAGVLFFLLIVLAALTIYADANVFDVVHLEKNDIDQLLFWRSMFGIGYSITIIMTLLSQHKQEAVLPPRLTPNVMTDLKTTLVEEVSKSVAPEPINYTKLAHELAPLLSPPLPPEVSVNYEEIAQHLAPLLPPLMSQNAASLGGSFASSTGDIYAASLGDSFGSSEEAFEEAVLAPLQETPQEAVLAPLLPPSQATPRPRITVNLNEFQEAVRGERNTDKLPTTGKKKEPKPTTTGDTEAVKKIRRLVKKNPKLSAAQLAEETKVTRGYAGKIKAQVLAEMSA